MATMRQGKGPLIKTAPPVGALRFRPPAAAPPWNGTLGGAAFPASCPQNTPVGARDPRSEDCLYLNVAYPLAPEENATAALRPVMVWVHGGGFTGGGSGMYPFDADRLANRP